MNASWRLDVPLNGDGRPSFAARAGRRKSWVRTRGESMQRRPSADNLFALDDERLVDRAGPFFQSTGRFNISRQAPAHTARLIYWRDWFHSLVNTRTHRIVVLVVLAYLFLFVVFATLYMVIDESCLPDIHRHRANCTDPAAPPGACVRVSEKDFVRALFFSVETMMTLGYGVKDSFFGGCEWMWALITAQVLAGVLANSLLFGIVFTRLSRAEGRDASVVFSKSAVSAILAQFWRNSGAILLTRLLLLYRWARRCASARICSRRGRGAPRG